MDAKTLAIMDAMAEKIEALTARVEVAEKRLSEQCSCETWREHRQDGEMPTPIGKKWANDLRPSAMFPPMSPGDYLTQEEVNRILSEGSE